MLIRLGSCLFPGGEQNRTVWEIGQEPGRQVPLRQADKGSPDSYCPGRGTSMTRSFPSEQEPLRPFTASGDTCAAAGPFHKSEGWACGV